MSDFCVIGGANWRATKVLFASKVKEHQENTRKDEWFKNLRVWQLGLYKTFLYSRAKDAPIENFKFEILICFNSFITEHWTPLHQMPHIFPILLWNWAIFQLQKQSNNESEFGFLWVLKCSLTSLSNLRNWRNHSFIYIYIFCPKEKVCVEKWCFFTLLILQ